MNNIRAASVQFNHRPGDKAANLDRIRAFVKDAAAQQVDLIAFPEMCITGYWHVRHLGREADVLTAGQVHGACCSVVDVEARARPAAAEVRENEVAVELALQHAVVVKE